MTDDDVTYYAVHDPADPSRITYWRETAQGRKPWPNKANYAPVLLKRDVPALLTRQDRRAWVNAWFREELPKWQAAIDAAIDADPVGARARFVAFTSRCCCCGRALTDPASKCYGVGPECRADVSAGLLAELTVAVGRAHAAHLEGQEAEHASH